MNLRHFLLVLSHKNLTISSLHVYHSTLLVPKRRCWDHKPADKQLALIKSKPRTSRTTTGQGDEGSAMAAAMGEEEVGDRGPTEEEVPNRPG